MKTFIKFRIPIGLLFSFKACLLEYSKLIKEVRANL